MLTFLNRTFSRRAATKSLVSAGAAGMLGASLAKGNQPFMEAALRALNNAAAQLEQAVADKGGHRAKAIQLVSQAINEVQAGIQYAK
jgi:hypothetical protein